MLEINLPLPIGARVMVTDDKGRKKYRGTIVEKKNLYSCGSQYLVEFDEPETGWGKNNRFTDRTSEKNNLLWCNSSYVTEIL